MLYCLLPADRLSSRAPARLFHMAISSALSSALSDHLSATVASATSHTRFLFVTSALLYVIGTTTGMSRGSREGNRSAGGNWRDYHNVKLKCVLPRRLRSCIAAWPE